MDRVLSDARNTDVGAIKQVSMTYLTPIESDDIPMPTAQQLREKTNRGFHNLVTARMLTPYQRLSDFDENPQA